VLKRNAHWKQAAKTGCGMRNSGRATSASSAPVAVNATPTPTSGSASPIDSGAVASERNSSAGNST